MHPKALTEAQRRLVEQNIGLARSVAARFWGFGRAAGLEWDDLFSIACMGLVYGAQRYDPAISRPGTYLYNCCRWVLLRELQRSRCQCRAGTVCSLDEPIQQGSRVATFGELLEDDADVEEEVLTALAMQRAWESATPRERIVATMYASGATQRDISLSIGTSQTTVSNALHSLRKKVHAALG